MPSIRYEIASLTKNVVAVSTMKLLRLRGLTVNTPVGPYLPADWTRGSGFRAKDAKKVTFGQLLTHTSGIQQAMKTAACEDVCRNDWDGLRALVMVGVVPQSPRVYKNANYALLRVLDARLWKAAGGKVTGYKTVYVESTNWKGDEIKKPKLVRTSWRSTPPRTRATRWTSSPSGCSARPGSRTSAASPPTRRRPA